MSEADVGSPQRSPILTSGLELKNLKRQVLKDAYDVQTVQRQPNQLPLPPERTGKNYSEGSLRSSRSVQLLPTHEMGRQQSIRNMLKESYEEDIYRKKMLKEKEKKSIREEQDILNTLSSLSRPVDKAKRQKEQYARILDEEIRIKQMKKRQEKQKLKRQINQSDSIRQKRKMGALQKQNSFKQYFSKVNQFRNSVSNDYLKYVNESPKKNGLTANPQKQLMEQHRKLLQTQIKQERKKNQDRKNQLRTVLQQQIMDNRSFKASQLNQYKNRGYIKNEMNSYNPISNPIDYQLDINNKYLLREIIQKQNDVRNRHLQ